MNDTTSKKMDIATFGGGCFWCMQTPFESLDGVVKTDVGYMGGHVENPTYEQVCSGTTGHLEVMQVTYDPHKVPYEQLLETFWHNIDPTDNKGQFCDKGSQYRSAIFYHDEEQKKIAEASRDNLIKSGSINIVYTEILPAKKFYRAEEYHQDYSKKSKYRYDYYRYMSGRDEKLKELWKK